MEILGVQTPAHIEDELIPPGIRNTYLVDSTRWGPLTTKSGCIPSYTHLQPWLNMVCWGYNYLITRAAPSCSWWLNQPI